MDPKQRRAAILARLSASGEVGVDDLAGVLGVSRETIRRDLAQLDAARRLRKVHGGARALAGDEGVPPREDPFAERMELNRDAKRRIGTAAAGLFGPGTSLFIDTGSTTVAFAEALSARSGLTVITNAPRIAARAAEGSGNKVFLIGGAYGADAGESLGPLALEQIGRFRAETVVLTVGAIDADCVMDFDLQEAEVAKAMIRQAAQVMVLVDRSKAGKRAVFTVASLSEVDVVVTDAPLPEPIRAALVAAGASIVTAP
ncbi:MAG: DeoR/GlpR transcriptional regulator [Defluviimonas sp.]|uniref:DeoR/GlpR family DNA-binding transcription regulator n=1 Tax=Albidovulum sp. TaxID=1872424 RepID=UPI002A27F3E2|nr:DeoR/GlpR transcriptional regulator [Defluviimonas sp.]